MGMPEVDIEHVFRGAEARRAVLCRP
jgi:hypothetical protein